MRKHQSWIALTIYAVAFAFWPLDRRDVAGFLTHLFPPTPLGNGVGYLIAAAVVAVGAAWITWAVAHGSLEAPGAATVICWIGFGLLLNLGGLIVVAIGTTALAARFRRGEPELGSDAKPDWKRGTLQSAHVWIAAAALVALARTLRETVFFEFLAGALVMRILVSVFSGSRRYRVIH